MAVDHGGIECDFISFSFFYKNKGTSKIFLNFDFDFYLIKKEIVIS
jgi:hypothetical protein